MVTRVVVNAAAALDLFCKQGQTFEQNMRWRQPDPNTPGGTIPVDLTGKSLRAQVRKTANNKTVFVTLVSPGAGGDRIEITSAVDGQWTIRISAATMATIPEGTWVWDLEAISGVSQEISHPLLEGKFTVSPEITRA